VLKGITNMGGKLIIIDGSDGSGKATQTARLYERLKNEGLKVRKVEFPNYNSDSSALIKMYLNGQFGTDPNDVNPYAASTFYAVDRFASYKTEWKSFYDEGGIILCDRYTTSNMIHQAAKIQDPEEKYKFLDWLWDYEFNLFKLPVPDCVVFLNMPWEYSRRLMEERNNKFTGSSTKDIHERNNSYMEVSYKNALAVAEKYSWKKVNCTEGNRVRSIEELHDEIYDIVKLYCYKDSSLW
jgi:dTMP kinase